MERAVPVLPGDDISVAKDFYVEGLGFQVSFEMTMGSRDSSASSAARSHSRSIVRCPDTGEMPAFRCRSKMRMPIIASGRTEWRFGVRRKTSRGALGLLM
jgi:hypothetical protein